jgi:predicted CoA-binding protein
MNKPTLVIGASSNEERYSNKAIKMLVKHQHDVKAIGQKEGVVEGVTIDTTTPHFENIDTVTLYINPTLQENYYEYILSLNPKRIIFNPGTENPIFYEMFTSKGIEAIEACTLVLLTTTQY